MFGKVGLNLPGGGGGADDPPAASLQKYAEFFPPAFGELINQVEDLHSSSRHKIAERCVETTLKMMRPEDIEKALAGDQEAATKLRTQVSNTIMSKFLLYMQIETDNVKPRPADLTADYIDESLDELQLPSADEPSENRLRAIRSPIKLAREYWKVQKYHQPYTPQARHLTEYAFTALWRTAEAVDKTLDEMGDIAVYASLYMGLVVTAGIEGFYPAVGGGSDASLASYFNGVCASPVIGPDTLTVAARARSA